MSSTFTLFQLRPIAVLCHCRWIFYLIIAVPDIVRGTETFRTLLTAIQYNHLRSSALSRTNAKKMLFSLVLMAYWSSMILGRFAECALMARQTGLTCTTCSDDGASSANVQPDNFEVTPVTRTAQTTDEDNGAFATVLSYIAKGEIHHPYAHTLASTVRGPKLPPRAALVTSISTSSVMPESVTRVYHKTPPSLETSPMPSS